MTIKRKDFQKAAATVHEFLLKLGFEPECAELRDALNLALLHMQRYYRLLRTRMANIDKTSGSILAQSLRGLSPMTPFKDAPDKFQWRWINLDNPKLANHLPADVNKDVSKLPPLIQAAKDGRDERIPEILERDPDSALEVDGLGRNALMYAVHFGHLDMMQVLLENGIDVSAVAHDGSTAAHRACHDGNHDALQILISYGANVAIADSQGRYPIHWACACQHRDCLKLLVDQGAAVGLRDKEGMSPSHWACRLDHIEHFELLTQAEHEPEEEDGVERDSQGRTWIHWSVRRTEPVECLRTLLTEEAANWRDDEKKSVMHTCAEQGSLAAAKVVLEIAGPSVLEHRDHENRTPLILAAYGGHGEVLNYLLAQGADHASVDTFGASVWDYARAKQLHYCMLIIASYIRQRAKEEERAERGEGRGLEDLHPGADLSDLALNGMGSLQINGIASTGEQLYLGNRPVAPPHPPQEPPTPRTPRTTRHAYNTPRGGPSLNGTGSRGVKGWPTPTGGHPHPVPSSRSPPPMHEGGGGGGGGMKRIPSESDSNGENGGGGALNKTYTKPSKRQSTAGKRRKNEHMSPERESRMSIQSVNASSEFAAEPPRFEAESEYLNESGADSEANGEEGSVSIAAMEVSDYEGYGQEGDDERTIIEDDERLQAMEAETPRANAPQTHRGPPPGREPMGRGDASRGGASAANQSRQSSHKPHPQPRHSPPHAPPTTTHQQAPYYPAHNREEHYDEEDEGEVIQTPSPPPRQGKPYSFKNQGGPSPSPPPYLQPLPPPSPGKKKKKKKRERDSSRGTPSSHLAPVAGPIPPYYRGGPAGGYVAPLQPPPSPYPSSTSGASSSHHQIPTSPRGRSPTSRNSSAVSTSSRNSGGVDPLFAGLNQGGGGDSRGGGGGAPAPGGYMSGGLVGATRGGSAMKVQSNKVQGGFAGGTPDGDAEYRQANNHASLSHIPASGNKPPVFPKAAPRSKSQKLNPIGGDTQSQTNMASGHSINMGYQQSPNRDSRQYGGGQGHQRSQPPSRIGSGSSQQFNRGRGGLPNGNLQNGHGNEAKREDQSISSMGHPQKPHPSRMESGSRKQHRSSSHPSDHPQGSPRGSRTGGAGLGPPPQMSGKGVANGRLPPTY